MRDVEKLVRGANILVVEDNLGSRRLLSMMLAKNGFEVQQAETGEQALDLVEANSPDLVLLDIMMPGMDGFEVCEALKSNQDTQDIPVIFISALDETQNVLKGLELGAVDYITKPFQPVEVKARVGTHLTLRGLHTRLEAVNIELAGQVEQLAAAKRELESRNADLQEALATIKTLSGFVPICAWCHRKIQDDGGQWVELEAYLESRSEVEFTHGICPECAAKWKPAE